MLLWIIFPLKFNSFRRFWIHNSLNSNMCVGLPVCLAVCLSLCCISKYIICVQRRKRGEFGFREELRRYDWRGQRLRLQSRMIVYLTSPRPHKHIKNKSALTVITKYQMKAGTTKSFKEDPQCNQVIWKEKKKKKKESGWTCSPGRELWKRKGSFILGTPFTAWKVPGQIGSWSGLNFAWDKCTGAGLLTNRVERDQNWWLLWHYEAMKLANL